MSVEAGDSNPYTPSPRRWTDKSWLYDQYWGELQSVSEMAEAVDVSRQTLLREMNEQGIPRRPSSKSFESHEDVVRAYSDRNRGHDPPSVDDGKRSWDDVCGVAD